MHAVGVDIAAPTWAEELGERVELYRLEQGFRDLERRWQELDDHEMLDVHSGEILGKAEVLAGELGASNEPTKGIQSVIRWAQNEEYRADVYRDMARRYRAVSERLDGRARAAEKRRARLKDLLVKFLGMVGGRYRLPEGTLAYVSTRLALKVEPQQVDTIPDEWWMIRRVLNRHGIMKAHRMGEPIPIACTIERVPTVVIR